MRVLTLSRLCADEAGKPESLFAPAASGGREGAQPDQTADSVRGTADGRGGRGPSNLGPSGQVDAAAGARLARIPLHRPTPHRNFKLETKSQVGLPRCQEFCTQLSGFWVPKYKNIDLLN
jgi:hypothetical protein